MKVLVILISANKCLFENLECRERTFVARKLSGLTQGLVKETLRPLLPERSVTRALDQRFVEREGTSVRKTAGIHG